MYAPLFGFYRPPFAACDGGATYFVSAAVESLLPRLLHTLRSDLGIAVLTGPVGSGKSTLLKHLRFQLMNEGRVVICSGALLENTAALHQMLWNAALRKAGDGSDAAGLSSEGTTTRWQIVERLQRSRELWGPVFLLLDDAHLLPLTVMNELRAWTEDASLSSDHVRCLLAGPLSLEDELARPSHADVGGRIRCHGFLQPLTPPESVTYLKQMLHAAGGELKAVVTADAVDELVTAAGGLPRCLNLLADEAFVIAGDRHQPHVDLAAVHAALQRLEHLPYPWNIRYAPDQEELAAPQPNTNVTSRTASLEYADAGVFEVGAPQPNAAQAESVVEIEVQQVLELDAAPDEEPLPTAEEPLPTADFVDQLIAVLEDDARYEMPDWHRQSAELPSNHATADLTNRIPVFDRYTWIALGREVPVGDNLHAGRRGGRPLPDEPFNGGRMVSRCTMDQIATVNCTDRDIQLMLSFSRRNETNWQDGSLLQLATQPISVNRRTGQNDHAGEPGPGEDPSVHEMSHAGWESAEPVSILFPGQVSSIPVSEHSGHQNFQLPHTETTPFASDPAESSSRHQLASEQPRTEALHFFTLPASLQSLDHECQVAPDGHDETLPLAATVAEIQSDVRRFHDAARISPVSSQGTEVDHHPHGRFRTLFTRLREVRGTVESE